VARAREVQWRVCDYEDGSAPGHRRMRAAVHTSPAEPASGPAADRTRRIVSRRACRQTCCSRIKTADETMVDRRHSPPFRAKAIQDRGLHQLPPLSIASYLVRSMRMEYSPTRV